MSDSDQLRRSAERLGALLSRIEQQAKVRRATGLAIPVVDDDPDADDPTNLWLFADGQVNVRTPDGITHRFLPTAGPAAVPTFSTAPSFSSGYRLWFNGTTGNLEGYLANGTKQTFTAAAAATSTDGGEVGSTSNTSTVAKPADPSPTKHVRTYASTWEKAYCSRHGDESDLYYGYYPGAHGERRVMFGFDAAGIADDLDGASIKKVELKGRNSHAWANAGVTIHFGTHTKSSAPGSYSANRRDAYVGDWPRAGYGGGSDDWRTVSSSIGKWFRDGSIKGLTIDNPASTTSYGEFAKDTLKLRITYVN